jgi:hypothetical protein
MRQFSSGATRDDETGKLDYEGFISPLVEKRFATYMHRHRVQADGQLRASDNWQKGIDQDAYMKSATRHFQDWRLHHDGFPREATESLEDALCALMFNTMGYLFEVLVPQTVKVLPPHVGCCTTSHPGFERSAVEWVRECCRPAKACPVKRPVQQPSPSDAHSPSGS